MVTHMKTSNIVHERFLQAVELADLKTTLNCLSLLLCRYHLQALRHLYVQASEPRLLMPVDIDTGEACYVPVQLTLKSTQYYDRFTYMSRAPSMLPELDLLEQVFFHYVLVNESVLLFLKSYPDNHCAHHNMILQWVLFVFITAHLRTIPTTNNL